MKLRLVIFCVLTAA